MKTTKQISTEITATEEKLARHHEEVKRLKSIKMQSVEDLLAERNATVEAEEAEAALAQLRTDLTAAQEAEREADRQAKEARLRELDGLIMADKDEMAAFLETLETQARERLDAHNAMVAEARTLARNLHGMNAGSPETCFSGAIAPSHVALVWLGEALARYREGARFKAQRDAENARLRAVQAEESRRHAAESEARRLQVHAAHDLARAQKILGGAA
ncbi:MAG TPA: hypothetical protein VN033_12330 [Vulgatibacter sp.]|nr:hypothetical protein [Vulgatibacter sp.]